MPRIHRINNGFTIVELLVVMTIIPIILTSFISVMYTTLDSTTASKNQLALQTQDQAAMQVIETDARNGKTFLTTAAAPYADTYGPDNTGAAWSYKGTGAGNPNSRVLMISVPATTLSTGGNARAPVFQNSTYGCGTTKSYNPTVKYIAIFFVRNSILYRRILTDPTPSIGCNAQAQKQSCPPELAGSWNSAACLARDEILATKVSAFSIDYYSQRSSSPISDAYTSSDPTSVTNADDVGVTITSSQLFAGNTLTGTLSLRIPKINQEL